MASPTRWTWVWVNSGSWWWTGRPGVLQSMGLQRVDTTEQRNWTEAFLNLKVPFIPWPPQLLSHLFRLHSMNPQPPSTPHPSKTVLAKVTHHLFNAESRKEAFQSLSCLTSQQTWPLQCLPWAAVVLTFPLSTLASPSSVLTFPGSSSSVYLLNICVSWSSPQPSSFMPFSAASQVPQW